MPSAIDPNSIKNLPMIGDVNMFFKDEGEVECEVSLVDCFRTTID